MIEQFPKFLRTVLAVSSTNYITLPSGGGDSSAMHLAFKQNCILNCGPASQLSDSTNFGSYATNFPVGINYLLGSSVFSNTQKAPYSRFMVVGSKITLKMIPGNTVVEPLNLVLWPNVTINQAASGSVSITQSINNLIEQPDSKYKMISEVAAQQVVMTHRMSTKKAFGLTRNLATEDTPYTGNYNTDPANVCNWILSLNNATLSTIYQATLCVTWRIDYDVIFYDRNMFTSGSPS